MSICLCVRVFIQIGLGKIKFTVTILTVVYLRTDFVNICFDFSSFFYFGIKSMSYLLKAFNWLYHISITRHGRYEPNGVYWRADQHNTANTFVATSLIHINIYFNKKIKFKKRNSHSHDNSYLIHGNYVVLGCVILF